MPILLRLFPFGLDRRISFVLGSMLRGWHYLHRILCSSSRRQLFSTEMRNIRLLITIIIISISCHLIGCQQDTYGIDAELEEGSQCVLENGHLGISKKLSDCPDRENGTLNYMGFIICCPFRQAEIACRQYNIEIRISEDMSPLSTWPALSGRVGVSEEPFEFPYMVSLGYIPIEEDDENASNITYSCAGILISSEHVLAPARCVHYRIPVEVRLGNVKINNNEGIQRIPISNIISHPQYRCHTINNDVAILKLKFKAQISDIVKPICLETKSVTTLDITPSTNLVVIGWGETDNFKQSDELKKKSGLSLVNNYECNKSYSKFRRQLPHGIDDSMICVTDPKSTRMADACLDDNGPLLLSTKSGVSVIGIAAFGISCDSSMPNVYTAIYPFLDWIEKYVWPLTDRDG